MIDQLTAIVTEQIATNDFFQGGAALAAFGYLAYFAREIPNKIGLILRRWLLVEAHIHKPDIAYRAMVDWLAQHPYGRRVKRFTAEVRMIGDNHDEAEVTLSPSPGNHLLWHAGRPIRVYRARKDSDDTESGLRIAVHESFTLQSLGHSRQALESLITEAVRHYTNKKAKGVETLVMNPHGGWDGIKTQTRPVDSVVLREGLMDRLVTDVQKFVEGRQYYADRGIPYYRGYMFHGPPGTGKTSVCAALASHFRYNLAVMPLSDSALTDSKLAIAITNLPSKTAMLIEDLDCLFDENRCREDGKGVTLSGLLNILDGAMAQEGSLVFMTTNHPERLDPAIMRPGRCDLITALGLADQFQLETIYLRFFPGDHEGAREFCSVHGDQKISTAEAQQALMAMASACGDPASLGVA